MLYVELDELLNALKLLFLMHDSVTHNDKNLNDILECPLKYDVSIVEYFHIRKYVANYMQIYSSSGFA